MIERMGNRRKAILRILGIHGELYGRQIVRLSDGALHENTAYRVLRKMACRGWLTRRVEHLGLVHKTYYSLSPEGVRLFEILEKRSE